MTGPLAQQIAQLRSFRDFIPDWNDGPTGLPEEFDAALSAIERHVQDMEKALEWIAAEEPDRDEAGGRWARRLRAAALAVLPAREEGDPNE